MVKLEGEIRPRCWCHCACQLCWDPYRQTQPHFSLQAQQSLPSPKALGKISRFTQGKERWCQMSDFCSASREESHCVEDGKWHNNACSQEQQAQGVNPLLGWQVSPGNIQVTQHQMESRFSHTERRWNRNDFNSGVCPPVARGLSLLPTQDNDLHIPFCAAGKGACAIWKRSSSGAGWEPYDVQA